jgi:hypothetical protein
VPSRVHRSFPSTLIAFAATPRDNVDEIIAAVAVGDFVARVNVLDGAQDDLVPDRAGFSVRPARMICVACEVLAARSVDHPPTVDLVEIAVAARLELFSLRGRELAAFVFDDKGTRLDRRCSKEPKPGRERPTRKACLRGISGIYNDSYRRQDALFPIRAPGGSLKGDTFPAESIIEGRGVYGRPSRRRAPSKDGKTLSDESAESRIAPDEIVG